MTLRIKQENVDSNEFAIYNPTNNISFNYFNGSLCSNIFYKIAAAVGSFFGWGCLVTVHATLHTKIVQRGVQFPRDPITKTINGPHTLWVNRDSWNLYKNKITNNILLTTAGWFYWSLDEIAAQTR